MQRAFGCSGWR